MKQVLMYVIMLLVMLTTVNALTLFNTTLQSEESNINITFDESVDVNSVGLTNESITLTNIVIDSCPIVISSYTWSTPDTAILSSSFYSFFDCQDVTKYSEDVGNIIVLGIMFALVSIFIMPWVPREYIMYYLWMVVGAITLVVIYMVL